jgi:hypothetical protein
MADVDPVLPYIQPGWVGVEIGVSEGISAEALLRRGVGFLYLVDPWEPYQGIQCDDETLLKCVKRLRPYSPRYAIYRMRSLLARQFIQPPLHFVWIDGDHSHSVVKMDVEDWFDFLRPNGILCGHDYTNNETCQVKQAVDEFAAERGLKVENPTPCWVIRK